MLMSATVVPIQQLVCQILKIISCQLSLAITEVALTHPAPLAQASDVVAH
jgi:hypothetical protein